MTKVFGIIAAFSALALALNHDLLGAIFVELSFVSIVIMHATELIVKSIESRK